MALTKEDLQAIGALMDQKLENVKSDMAQMMDEKLEPVKSDMAQIKQDLDILKEEAAITRHTGDLLIKWAEKADRAVVNVGLYDDKE